MSEQDATLDEFVGSETQSDEEGFIETAAGKIPVDWSTTSVEEVCELRNGEATDHVEIGAEPYLVYGSNGPIGSYSESNFEGGLIFGRVGAVGEVERVTEPVWVSDNAIQARVSGDINSEYLYYYLTDKELSALATKTAQPLLNQSTIGNVTVPTPPIEERRKIASVLYTVDQAVQQTETVVEQVRTVQQGVLQDMMKGRGSDKPLEEKRVGPRTVLLPKDWDVVQIGDAIEQEIILKQQDGNHGSDYPRKDEFVDEGVPYLSAEMLSEGKVDFLQAKYLTEERANQLRIGFAEDGDVLLAHNATVGPAGLLKTDRDLVIIGTSLTYYRCNSEKLDNKYLTYFFQSRTFQKQLHDVMRQSTRNQVPITRQRNLNLILPPVDEQRKISGRIDTIIERLRRESTYHERLQRLKKGLMQDLLSGEIRTHDKDIELVDDVLQHG